MTTFYDQQQKPIEKPYDAPVVWRPSVYGVLENENEEWFFVDPVGPDGLDLPGGGVEKGELIREALVREFYEETGYRVTPDEQPVYIGQRNFYHPTIGFCHAIFFFYRVTLDSEKRDEHVVNTFDDGHEIQGSKWMKLVDVKETDVNVIYWPFIKKIQSERK